MAVCVLRGLVWVGGCRLDGGWLHRAGGRGLSSDRVACGWGWAGFARCSTITMVEIVGWELVSGVVALFGDRCRGIGVGVRGVFG